MFDQLKHVDVQTGVWIAALFLAVVVALKYALRPRKTRTVPLDDALEHLREVLDTNAVHAYNKRVWLTRRQTVSDKEKALIADALSSENIYSLLQDGFARSDFYSLWLSRWDRGECALTATPVSDGNALGETYDIASFHLE